MSVLKPVNGRLVVKRAQALSKTSAGILIIDSDVTKPNVGEVISVSDDVKNVKVGDQVLFDHTTGTEVKVHGETNFVLHENNLFGVVKEESVVPLKNTILFKFLDSTGGGKGEFSERSKGSIIIPTLKSEQTTRNRWGQVYAVGPDVASISEGDYILIAAQQWTKHENWKQGKLWKTVDLPEAVLCATDDVDLTVEF